MWRRGAEVIHTYLLTLCGVSGGHGARWRGQVPRTHLFSCARSDVLWSFCVKAGADMLLRRRCAASPAAKRPLCEDMLRRGSGT